MTLLICSNVQYTQERKVNKVHLGNVQFVLASCNAVLGHFRVITDLDVYHINTTVVCNCH